MLLVASRYDERMTLAEVILSSEESLGVGIHDYGGRERHITAMNRETLYRTFIASESDACKERQNETTNDEFTSWTPGLSVKVVCSMVRKGEENSTNRSNESLT